MTHSQEKKIVTDSLAFLYKEEGYKIRFSEKVNKKKDHELAKLKCLDKDWRYIRKHKDVDKRIIYWSF